MPVAVDVRGAHPWLFKRTAGRRDIKFLEILPLHLAENLHFFVRDEHDKVLQAILVGVVEGHERGIGFEILVHFLRGGLAARRACPQNAFAVLVHDHGQRRSRAFF